MNIHPNPNRKRGVQALMESAARYKSVLPIVHPVEKSPESADSGELWRERLPASDEREPLLLYVIDRVQMENDGPVFCVVAPVHSFPRMASEAEIVLPYQLLGFEAVVSLGSAGSVLATSLATCEGTLPQEWHERLLSYYAYVRGSVAAPPQSSGASSISQDNDFAVSRDVAIPPHSLTVGAPILDGNDPAYAFNESLIERMEFIQAPALAYLHAKEPTAFREAARRILDAITREWAGVADLVRGLGSANLPQLLPAAAQNAPASSLKWHLSNRVSSELVPADADSCYLRIESGDPTLQKLEYGFEGEPVCFGNVELLLVRGSYWAEIRVPLPFASLHHRTLTVKPQTQQ